MRYRIPPMLAAAAGVVVLASVLTGCDKSGGPPPQSLDRGGNDSAPTTTAPPVDCVGLGQPPADAGGEVTWVEGGRLWAAVADGSKRCLIDEVGDAEAVTWGGRADRVLVGNKVILGDGRVEEPFPDGGEIVLSRPTGKSVLEVRNGKLMKRELGKSPIEITFLEPHEQTVYHPAGLHIVSIGRNGTDAGLHIATNTGEASSGLVQGETARRIYDPTFTASGALLFFADHGSYTELHRLEIDQGELTTVATEDSPAGMDHLVASPFEGGGVAWAQGPCDPATESPLLRAQRGGKYLATAGTAIERGQPVGWTPDAALIVMVPGSCRSGGAPKSQVLYRFKDGEATEVARGVQAAAIRAVVPPPPPPPDVIPQQAPA